MTVFEFWKWFCLGYATTDVVINLVKFANRILRARK